MKTEFFNGYFKPVSSLLRRGSAAAADFLLPPLCFCCDAPITQTQALCATCWKELHFVTPPFCARCGAPFDIPVEEGTLCGACLEKEPVFSQARSALVYDEASRPIILKLKHGDRLHPVPALAGWMIRAAEKEIWQKADMIVPVPLHRWRLLKRRYNQAALLGKAIGKLTERDVCVDALVRVQATESQGHKSKAARHRNVEGAFVARNPARIAGKHIVLIDDVLTSGATANACAKALFAAGAASVALVTLARTRIAS